MTNSLAEALATEQITSSVKGLTALRAMQSRLLTSYRPRVDCSLDDLLRVHRWDELVVYE